MTELAVMNPGALVDHYRMIATERMQGLPIVNPHIEVEAVGFRDLDEHRFGVLIAPWFMNMVVLPRNDEWDALAQGDKVMLTLPAGEYEFTVCRDDAFAGCYLSAVLFRAMTDFPGQATARAVALEVAERLFDASAERQARLDERPAPRRCSRRDVLSNGGA